MSQTRESYMYTVFVYALTAFVALASLAIAVLAVVMAVMCAYYAPAYLVVVLPLCFVVLHVQKGHFKKIWAAINHKS